MNRHNYGSCEGERDFGEIARGYLYMVIRPKLILLAKKYSNLHA